MRTIFKTNAALVTLIATLLLGSVNAASNPINSSHYESILIGQNASFKDFNVSLTGVNTVVTGGNYIYPADIGVYYNGLLTNVTQMVPNEIIAFTVDGKNIFVMLNNTYYGGTNSDEQYAVMKVCSANPSNQTAKPDCSKLKTVYTNESVLHGKFRVVVQQINQEVRNPTTYNAYAYFNIFHDGKLQENATVSINMLDAKQDNMSEFTIGRHTLFINVSQIFDSVYQYQQWAGLRLYVSDKTPSINTTYVGHNQTCGQFTLELADLGQPDSSGVSNASVDVYYKGVLTNVTSIAPRSLSEFNVKEHYLDVYVNQTFAGLYAYQKWAKLQLFC